MSAVIENLPVTQQEVNPNLFGEDKNMAGARHSGVGVRLIIRLGSHVEENNLGGIYGADATFVIGRRDRLPDVSFVSASRIPPEGEPETKWHLAPDLAVEIISPNDIYSEIEDKIYDYFSAGVKQVWVISSEHKTLTIFHSPTQTTILTKDDVLTCEELFPNFRLSLKEVFKMPASVKAE